jgi:hypothetical protein
VAVDVNVKLAEALALGFAGVEVMLVSGGGPPTSQLYMAGDASMLPAASTARTENVCMPFDNPTYPVGLAQVL